MPNSRSPWSHCALRPLLHHPHHPAQGKARRVTTEQLASSSSMHHFGWLHCCIAAIKIEQTWRKTSCISRCQLYFQLVPGNTQSSSSPSLVDEEKWSPSNAFCSFLLPQTLLLYLLDCVRHHFRLLIISSIHCILIMCPAPRIWFNLRNEPMGQVIVLFIFYVCEKRLQKVKPS